MSTFTAFEEIEHGLAGARTRRVWNYWREQAGSTPAPDWTSFNLMDLYRDAPIMLVMDVLQPPGSDYRYRFVGTSIVRYRWRLPVPDHTGQRYSESVHQYNFEEIKAAYDKCCVTGLPILMRRNFDVYDASGVHERLILPILGDSGVEKLAVTVERLSEERKPDTELPPHF